MSTKTTAIRVHGFDADDYSRFRAWVKPKGLFIVVLGPDGAGKSTVIEHLIETTQTAFPGHRRFHWRPGYLWRGKGTGTTTDPHGQVPHSALWSVARIFSHILDYWAGYVTQIRPALMRSQLVIFDRYFYDLLVDQRRYRYGGPRWLIRALMPLVPKPNVVFVLDASEETVLSRKQELAIDELQRQRAAYLALTRTLRAEIICADRELTEVVRDVSQAVMRRLSRRTPTSR